MSEDQIKVNHIRRLYQARPAAMQPLRLGQWFVNGMTIFDDAKLASIVEPERALAHIISKGYYKLGLSALERLNNGQVKKV